MDASRSSHVEEESEGLDRLAWAKTDVSSDENRHRRLTTSPVVGRHQFRSPVQSCYCHIRRLPDQRNENGRSQVRMVAVLFLRNRWCRNPLGLLHMFQYQLEDVMDLYIALKLQPPPVHLMLQLQLQLRRQPAWTSLGLPLSDLMTPLLWLSLSLGVSASAVADLLRLPQSFLFHLLFEILLGLSPSHSQNLLTYYVSRYGFFPRSHELHDASAPLSVHFVPGPVADDSQVA